MIERPGPLPHAAQAWHTRPMGLAFHPAFERELPGRDPTAGDGKGVAVDL